jgi:hypothetical protein
MIRASLFVDDDVSTVWCGERGFVRDSAPLVLFCLGDAPEPISLHAQRNRRKKGARKALSLTGRPRAHAPPRGTAATRHPGASLLGRRPCRPTPCRGARSRQGQTGTGKNAFQTSWALNERVRSVELSDSPCFDIRSPLIACLADVRLGGDGRQGSRPSSPSQEANGCGPRSGVRSRGCPKGQAILGVRFFRRFLCAFKETGSGASPIRIETPCIESRPKPTTTRCRNVGWGKRSAPQRMQRRSCWGSLRSPQPTGALLTDSPCFDVSSHLIARKVARRDKRSWAAFLSPLSLRTQRKGFGRVATKNRNYRSLFAPEISHHTRLTNTAPNPTPWGRRPLMGIPA